MTRVRPAETARTESNASNGPEECDPVEYPTVVRLLRLFRVQRQGEEILFLRVKHYLLILSQNRIWT